MEACVTLEFLKWSQETHAIRFGHRQWKGSFRDSNRLLSDTLLRCSCWKVVHRDGIGITNKEVNGRWWQSISVEIYTHLVFLFTRDDNVKHLLWCVAAQFRNIGHFHLLASSSFLHLSLSFPLAQHSMWNIYAKLHTFTFKQPGMHNRLDRLNEAADHISSLPDTDVHMGIMCTWCKQTHTRHTRKRPWHTRTAGLNKVRCCCDNVVDCCVVFPRCWTLNWHTYGER